MKGRSKLSGLAGGGYDDVELSGVALASLPEDFASHCIRRT